ncbi:MAG: hypothetical protein H7333_12685, partial [Bdellovibrionales bacterium]|nr:hypothetical protein [Oligoflexia bacterium]
MTFSKSFNGLLLLGVTLSAQAWAMNPYSKNAGEAYVKLPEVKKGGTLYLRQLSNPKALNPLLTNDVEYKDILHLLFARLLEKDYETGEFFPL